MRSSPTARLSVFIGLIFTTSSAIAADGKEPVFEVQVVPNVTYYDGKGASPEKHKLDLYLPKKADGFPVVLFLHGGGWSRGDKSYFGVCDRLCTLLAKHGIGAASANYRLSPSVQHPGHVEDAARAFAWLHRNIEKYGGRADLMFVSGHSAGGHLAALLATDATYLKAEGLTTEQIKGVVPISGVFRLPDSARMFQHAFGTDPKSRQAAAPTWQARQLAKEEIARTLPPFLILFAENDFDLCGKEFAEEFCKALCDCKCKAEAREIKDRNHVTIFVFAGKEDDVVPNAILKFVGAHVAR